MKPVRPILGVLLLLAFVAISTRNLLPGAAASGQGTDQASRPGVTVAIQTFQFKPTPLEIKVGTQVTWMNNDDITHTVTSGSPESRNGQFDAALSGKGATFSSTFTQPGTYPYFCNRHTSMRGEIHVK